MRIANMSLILLLMLALAAAAQDAPATPEKAKPAEKPSGPEFDEGAKKIWDAWKRMRYNLGAAGVKRCSHKIEATVKAMGQSSSGTAVFTWDGEKGSLDWDNPQLGAMLGQQGWSVDNLSGAYKADELEEKFDGCKITLKPGETEDRLVVSGGTKPPAKAFVFGKDGVLKKWVMAFPDPATGQTQEVDFTMDFEKLENGKCVNTGWSFTAQSGMGAYSEQTKLTIEKVADWYVLTAVDSTGSMGGQPMMTKTLRFTDWKFNDDLDKAEEKKKEQPAGTDTKPDDG